MKRSEEEKRRKNIEKFQNLSRSKNSDKVSNLVVTVRGSEKKERKKRKKREKKKAQKLKREKFFFPLLLQSGFLTSWLDPKKKKNEKISRKSAQGYSIRKERRKKAIARIKKKANCERFNERRAKKKATTTKQLYFSIEDDRNLNIVIEEKKRRRRKKKKEREETAWKRDGKKLYGNIKFQF